MGTNISISQMLLSMKEFYSMMMPTEDMKYSQRSFRQAADSQSDNKFKFEDFIFLGIMPCSPLKLNRFFRIKQKAMKKPA
jgi:hypothetical protein